jgi:hypothetical protein
MPTLEAPSGLVADVRKIKGTELIRLAESADDAGPDGGFGHVLSGCWLRTVDPGPYGFVQAGDVKPTWERMLKGDTLHAFVFLRSISMPDGDAYDFPVHCEECRKRYEWTIKISELGVRKLPAESAERLRAGKPFETHLADGKLVRFNLQTISQEGPITRLMKQQKREQATMIDTIVGQTISVEGVGPDIRARWRFISELDMDELYRLREAFDAADCGIETGLQTRCTNRQCRWEQDINLPLGKAFFAPRRRRQEQGPTGPSDEPNTAILSVGFSEDLTLSGAGSSSTTSSGTSTEEAATLSPTGT